MIKILIIDDHQSIIDSFSAVINTQDDMTFVGSSITTKDIEKLCKKYNPDVILADISIESYTSGIEMTKKIKSLFPHIKIITMSSFDEISYVPQAREVGADAFVSKIKPMTDFLDMIRAVMVGEGSFPAPIQIPTSDESIALSERELEILRLLCQSHTRKEIADELGISVGTVKRHIENMLRKLNCNTTLEMVVYVVGNGWIAIK